MPRKPKAQIGRPSKKKTHADEICRRIATSKHGLHRICRDIGDIDPSTVYDWIRQDDEFSDKYARAREMQADYMDELRIDVASGEYRKGGLDDQGNPSLFIDTPEAIQRDKLYAGHIQWSQSKLAPKKYGDKQTHEHSGVDGNPIEVQSPADKLSALLVRIAPQDDAESS